MRKQKLLPYMLSASLLAGIPVSAAEITVPAEKTELNEMISDKEQENDSMENEGKTEMEMQIEESLKEDSDTSAFDLLGADMDGVFADMQSALKNGETLSFSELFDGNTNMEFNQESKFDMSDMGLAFGKTDYGMTNLQFETLSKEMKQNYETTDLSGRSVSCMELFQDTYGGITKDLELGEVAIPEGFTVENMLSSASEAVNQAYGDVRNSESFEGIKSQISVGNIFDIASGGLSMPELMSSSSMESMLSEMSASQKNAMYSDFVGNTTYFMKQSEEMKMDSMTNLKSNFLGMVDMSGSLYDKDGNISKDALSDKQDEMNKLLPEKKPWYKKAGDKAMDFMKDSFDFAKKAPKNVINKIGDFFSGK